MTRYRLFTACLLLIAAALAGCGEGKASAFFGVNSVASRSRL
jgi:hypothetical protein